MSIVEDVGTPHEPVRRPVLGWLIALGIPIAQVVYGINVAVHTSGDARRVADAHNALFSWDDSLGVIAPIIGIAFVIGVAFIPGAFGFRRRQIVPFLPRGRWIIVLAFIALAVGVDVMLAEAGERGGFADAAGANWTANGAVVAHHDWNQASQRLTSCRMTGRHGDNADADYFVRFPDGRRADLAGGLSTDYAGARARRWIGRIAPIDQRLNALPQASQASFNGGGRFSQTCLSRYTEALTADEASSFRTLLHAPAATPAPTKS